MSDTEQEGMSERELAEWFTEEAVLGDKPRSVGEALQAADEKLEISDETEGEPEVSEQPIVVTDDQQQPEAPTPQQPEVPQAPGEEAEEPQEPTDEDENVAWAKRKYGDDPSKWAQAAKYQEQHISRLAAEKKEAEELAGQWYEYAQGVEQQATQQQQMGMPLSAQEENWVEQSVANPLQAARQAAISGNFNLYQGVIARIAEDNPMVAAQIGAQIEREMEQAAIQQQQQNGAQQQPSLADAMAGSIQRLDIDLNTYGEPMSAKIAELGEHHPYVRTILEGEPNARDIALMAVYDLVRTGAMSTRRVRSEERDEQIRHEAELRRQAAGVVTGGPQVGEQAKGSPFMEAMEEEWKQRGQWTSEE